MRVLVLSPHFDDAPLSLGQSMLSGFLEPHDVTVGVVFGRSAWVRWFHPTRRRAPVATAIRRIEERWNARRFGYRLIIGTRPEATLRLETTDTTRYLDPEADVAATGELEAVTRLTLRWAEGHDLVIAPLGIGDHIDHRITALAAGRLATLGRSVGFYADRPYAAAYSDEEIDRRAASVDPGLLPLDAAAATTREKLRRLWYPSQFDDQFVAALAADVTNGRCERIFLPSDQIRVSVASPRPTTEL